MSDHGSPPAGSTWVIRPNELQLEGDAPFGSRRIAHGRWRNSLVVVKILGEQVERSALHSRGERWASLRHPNILQAFGVSSLDANPLYLVTQFQPPGNATRFLEQYPQANRTKIVSEVALGMQYLHERGVVHGSLKPTNILIKMDGQACVSDYGMIEVQTSGSNGHRYFSPEAWKGTISRPSDVFAWAMSTLEIFTSKAPWGILSEKQIFRLVVRQDSRPDRPDEDFGLTDHIWGILEKCWQRDARQRPTFETVLQLLQNNIQISAEFRGKPHVVELADRNAENRESLRSHTSGALSITTQSSVPPAYEVHPNVHPHPGPASAPPAAAQFRLARDAHSSRTPPEFPSPRPLYGGSDAASILASYRDGVEQEPRNLPPIMTQHPDRRRLGPSTSVRTASSSVPPRSAIPAWAPSPSTSGGSPNRLRTMGEASSPRSLPATPFPVPAGYFKIPSTGETVYMKRTLSAGTAPSEYTPSTAVASPNASVDTVHGTPAMVGTATVAAPSATLLAGALLSEVKEGRKQDVIDALLSKIRKLGLQSHTDADKLVTAGTIPTLILLVKTRAVDGIGLEPVLVALGILTHDCITANTIYRTSTTMTLIEIVDATQSEDIAALAMWCLARVCRNTEIANGLLKQNIGRLLVTKGIRAGNWRTARAAAWCLGALIRTDGIADTLADIGLVTTLCEHLRRCSHSVNANPQDCSATIYAVARMSRSIKIAKAFASGGCTEMLAQCLSTAEDAGLLLWTCRAVGCLMRPNSGDMAKALLGAGIAHGLARVPNILPPEEVEPLGAFAFAIQRFSCAEWGGSTRKALVEAGVVDSLLAALRTAAEEKYPQVHIELANAIALLGDVGGTSIRREIVNAGGIDILKRVSSAATKAVVAKACNQAVTSIVGNIWSRNTASAKAALTHDWSGGCPDYFPDCPAPF